MNLTAKLRPSGKLSIRVIRAVSTDRGYMLRNRLRFGFWWGYLTVLFAKAFSFFTGIPTLTAVLYGEIIKPGGQRIKLGVLSYRVVTTAGVNYIVDAFQNTVELENLKYHALGEDNTAENVADTGLISELSTDYNPDNTRATGTTVEGASANIYRTVGTNTLDGAAAVVEHGIMSQAATGGGTLLDRSIFAVINLSAADGLQTTYELTLNSGG
jgi:hypothetical protein